MADSERRYGPTIDLQGFDLKMDMEALHEPSRLPLVVVIALVVLAAFAGVVWLAYTQGVERGRESVSRELTAGQFWKVHKPTATAYTGLKIYEPQAAVDQKQPENAATASKPKQANAIPALRPTASAAPDSLAPAAPQSIPATAPNQVGGSPALLEEKAKAAGTAAVPGASPQRVATRGPTQLTKPAAPPLPTHPLTEPDSLAPAPAATSLKPAAKQPAQPAAPPSHKPVTVSPPSTSASVSAPAAAGSHATTSGIVLQIGSYKSDAEARASWQAFKSEHDAAAPYQPDVKQADLGAKGTWYRLRMGPFPDKKSALETCRKLKADGASCLLAQ